MSSLGGFGSSERAATAGHRPDEGHPGSGADHSPSLLRRFEETDRFPVTSQEAKDAARGLKAAVEEYRNVQIDAHEQAIAAAKADIKAAETHLEALGQREQELQARGRALLADEKLGLVSLTDEQREQWTIAARGDLRLPERDNVRTSLDQARASQQRAERTLEEVQVQARELIEQAKEFARPWVDSTRWWRPLKSRDARMELMVRRSDHQSGQMQETLRGLQAEIAELRTRLTAAGDSPPPGDPHRNDQSDESDSVPPPRPALPKGEYSELQNSPDAEIHGIPIREIYAETDQLYTHLEREPHDPVARERFEILQLALEGGVESTAFARIDMLTNQFHPDNPFATNELRADALERLRLLRLGLHASPEDIATTQGEMSAEDMINGIRGLGDDQPERRAAVTETLQNNVEGGTDEERVQNLDRDRDRRNSDPMGLRAQRKWMMLMGIQQGAQSLIQGLFSFQPPQS